MESNGSDPYRSDQTFRRAFRESRTVGYRSNGSIVLFEIALRDAGSPDGFEFLGDSNPGNPDTFGFV